MSAMTRMPVTIPAIDLTPFLPSNNNNDNDELQQERQRQEQRSQTAAALDAAASTVGFFYVSLPGLAEAGERLLKRCQEFHALPDDVKQSVAHTLSPMYRGYNATWKAANNGGSCAARPGIDPPDPKETMMFGSECNTTSRSNSNNKEEQRSIHNGSSPMHGPNQWPKPSILPPGWRECLEDDWELLLQAAKILAKALAMALGEPDTIFDEALREPASVLLLLRYDASKLAPDSNGDGCGAHTDCGFLTFLAQQVGSAPLQVQRGSMNAGNVYSAAASNVDDDAWIDAPPMPNHLLVNLGDMLHRWTNGRYRSTVHRVRLLDNKNNNNAETDADALLRHSVAFFANPTYYCNVECFPSCCRGPSTPDMPPARFEPITAGKYISDRLGLMYQEEEEEEEKKE